MFKRADQWEQGLLSCFVLSCFVFPLKWSVCTRLLALIHYFLFFFSGLFCVTILNYITRIFFNSPGTQYFYRYSKISGITLNYIKWDTDLVFCAFNWEGAASIIFSWKRGAIFSQFKECLVGNREFYQIKRDRIWGILFKAIDIEVVLNGIKPEQAYITSQKTNQSRISSRSSWEETAKVI